MSTAHVAFSTPNKSHFAWTDSFEDVGNVELEQLIIECRCALHSLEAELAARQKPRAETNLEDCYRRLQEKVRTIKDLGVLGYKDRASLEEAGIFLETLRVGQIDSSQTRKTRKAGAMYQQLLWLVSTVAGPAYSLLLICGLARRHVERLNSLQSAILIKRIAQTSDSLSSPVLEKQAERFGLSVDATSPNRRTLGKRKRGQSDSETSSIAWSNPTAVSSNKSSPSNLCDTPRQVEQNVKPGASPLYAKYPGEANGLDLFEFGSNQGVLAPKTIIIEDNNVKPILPRSKIDYGAVSEPQSQLAAFNQPSPGSYDRLQDGGCSPANKAISNALGSRPLISEDGIHGFDGTVPTIKSAVNLPISNTQPKILPHVEEDFATGRCGTSDVAPEGEEAKDTNGQIGSAMIAQHLSKFANIPHLSADPPVMNPTNALNIMIPGWDEWSNQAASISRDCVSSIQLESESRNARTLLKLLCCLGGKCIPEFMLLRAREPQKIWSPSGEVQEVPVTAIGLNNDVLSLVSDNFKIDDAIKRLEAATLITSTPGPYGRRTLGIDSTTHLHLSQCMADRLVWRLQALILVCHTFPMHPYAEPLYGSLGKLQIHQVQYITKHYPLLKALITSRIKRKFAEVLLKASYFLDMSWKSEALEAVKAITADEPADYLRTWIKVRECTLTGLRTGSKIKESAIRSVRGDKNDIRSNALYGHLILSWAANIIRWDDLNQARSVLNDYSPLNSDRPSTMERLVLKQIEVTVGRIDRYQGKFLQAQARLTPPPDDDAKLDGVTGRSRISHLACVLCELGEPRKAQVLICEEIKTMEKLGSQDLPSGRGFRLLLAEALLQQELLDEAEDIYTGLKEVLEDCSNPIFTLGVEKLRLWIGLARIAHLKHSWSDALTKWETALIASEDCNWKVGFYEMVVRYSISHVKAILGEQEDSESHLKKADELYRREGRQFWLIGIGTYWLDFLWRSLDHRPEVL